MNRSLCTIEWRSIVVVVRPASHFSFTVIPTFRTDIAKLSVDTDLDNSICSTQSINRIESCVHQSYISIKAYCTKKCHGYMHIIEAKAKATAYMEGVVWVEPSKLFILPHYHIKERSILKVYWPNTQLCCGEYCICCIQ